MERESKEKTFFTRVIAKDQKKKKGMKKSNWIGQISRRK